MRKISAVIVALAAITLGIPVQLVFATPTYGSPSIAGHHTIWSGWINAQGTPNGSKCGFDFHYGNYASVPYNGAKLTSSSCGASALEVHYASNGQYGTDSLDIIGTSINVWYQVNGTTGWNIINAEYWILHDEGPMYCLSYNALNNHREMNRYTYVGYCN